jgi:hypothetical protein
MSNQPDRGSAPTIGSLSSVFDSWLSEPGNERLKSAIRRSAETGCTLDHFDIILCRPSWSGLFFRVLWCDRTGVLMCMRRELPSHDETRATVCAWDVAEWDVRRLT